MNIRYQVQRLVVGNDYDSNYKEDYVFNWLRGKKMPDFPSPEQAIDWLMRQKIVGRVVEIDKDSESILRLAAMILNYGDVYVHNGEITLTERFKIFNLPGRIIE